MFGYFVYFRQNADNSFIIEDYKIAPPARGFMKVNMESLFIILNYIVKGSQ